MKIKRKSPAFTLIELLVSISIITLLIGLFITNFDRATSGDRLATDAEVVKSKIAAVKLLAGSTQINDNGNSTDGSVKQAGYYGLYLPKGDLNYPNNVLYVVTMSLPLADNRITCPASTLQVILGPGICAIESVQLSSGVFYSGGTVNRIIAYKTPTQQIFDLHEDPTWKELPPTFGGLMKLTYQGKVATISMTGYSGVVGISYR